MSWLVVGYALWLMLFRPAATVLLFSKRDDEAVHLLNFRLRGMYERLPDWMRARQAVVENSHEFRLSNGCAALAFPTTGGRSYTATLAVVDEADHCDDLDGAAQCGQADRRRGRRPGPALDRRQGAPVSTLQAHLRRGEGRRQQLCTGLPALVGAARSDGRVV